MSIIPNSFRKQKKYITDENGDHELISTWTSTDTVETTDGETLTDYLDNHVDVEIEVTTPSGVAKRYTFSQNDTVIGTVDIPLDMVVSGATVETVTTADVPYEGAEVGDKYIDMVIANSSEDHIYIPCKDIISADSVDMVKQSPSTTNSNYEILFSATADNTERIETTKKSNKLLYNPGSNQLRVSDNNNYIGITEENIYIEHNSMDSSNIYVTLHDLRQGQRTSITPDYINVEQYDLDTHDSSILTMTHDDIELSDTWDGTNTSLKDAIADCDNTDENVEQANSTTNANYRVLLSHSANDTTETAGVYKSAGLIYNPNKKSLAEGDLSTANGQTSHAEGSHTEASGEGAHAEGIYTEASGELGSHAEGFHSSAEGNISHAEGSYTQASGLKSHTEGDHTVAEGNVSHAEGNYTQALHLAQHVFGEYNIIDNYPNAYSPSVRGKYVEIVGNGTNNNRSNARTLDWDGNEVLAGKITVGVAPTNDMDVATKKYVDDNAGGGTTVVPNPSGTASTDLAKLQIGNTIYGIPDGKVTQTYAEDTEYRVLLSNDNTDTTQTAGVKKSVLSYNTNSKVLSTGYVHIGEDYIDVRNGIIKSDDYESIYASGFIYVDENEQSHQTSYKSVSKMAYDLDNIAVSDIGKVIIDEIDTSVSSVYAIGLFMDGETESYGYTTGYLNYDADTDTLFSGNIVTNSLMCNDITTQDGYYDSHNTFDSISAIADAVYDLEQSGGGGTTVVANPQGAATGTLTKLQVGTDIYSVSGGSGSTNVVELTQTEYDALTQAQKENGSIYMVTDGGQASLVELTTPQTSSSTQVTASSYMVDYNLGQYHFPWAAFNRVSPSTWSYPTPGVTSGTAWSPNISQDGSNSWIQYYFEKAVHMSSMKIWAFADYSGDTTKSFIIEGSNDGTTWTNILASGNSCNVTATLHQNYENNIALDDTDAYSYVRLRSLEPMGAGYQPTIFIDEIFVYGLGDPINRIYYMDTEYANTEVGGDSGSGDSYSTDEQIVGTWIDDRPLYQKTYYYPNSWTSTNSLILDSTFLPSVYDNFFETDIHFTVNNDYINGNGQMGASGMEVFSSSSLGGLGLVNGADSATITNLYLTIRYTKVADL